MKTNPLTSKLNNLRQALRLRQTFRLLRQALCRLLCAQPNSPASPERRGGGQGAGWYTRLQAAEGIKEVRSPGRTKERKGAGGGLGTQPQRSKGGMLCNSPAPPPLSPSAGYSNNSDPSPPCPQIYPHRRKSSEVTTF